MNRKHWISFFYLLLVFALSTACLTLFPASTVSPATEEWDQPVDTPLKFDPPSLPDAKVGVPYDIEIKVTGNVTPVGDFLVDPETLPPGLELVYAMEEVPDRARIMGVPEQAGTYTFTIDVWCYGTNVSGQTGSKEYTIVVE